jgi:formylglycine-generating enzyme required for sulfatase activity
MEFVRIGDKNNHPNNITGSGTVGYEYEIGKFEVSNKQYCEFLNAVASVDDPHSLYNINMENGIFGGIRIINKDDRFLYEPLPKLENLPVVYVSWYDSARFCNWLHYGKPNTGRSEIGTTEGDDKNGAYDTRQFDKNPRGVQKVNSHNANALYWIPTLDEWDKAAYYDPTKNGMGGYWLYPTRTDTKPLCAPPGETPNSANYYDFKWAAPEPYLTPIGSYKKSSSYYGTFDQGGNVWEWCETLRNNGKQRWVRGGGATVYANTLAINNQDSEYGDHKLYIFGLRICRQVHKTAKSLNY